MFEREEAVMSRLSFSRSSCTRNAKGCDHPVSVVCLTNSMFLLRQVLVHSPGFCNMSHKFYFLRQVLVAAAVVFLINSKFLVQSPGRLLLQYLHIKNSTFFDPCWFIRPAAVLCLSNSTFFDSFWFIHPASVVSLSYSSFFDRFWFIRPAAVVYLTNSTFFNWFWLNHPAAVVFLINSKFFDRLLQYLSQILPSSIGFGSIPN